MDLYVYPIILIVFAAIFTREVIAPASQNHCDRRWLLLSTVLGASSGLIAVGIGYLLHARIKTQALISLPDTLPDVAVGFLGFFCTSFIFYWWHRATHRFDFLWRNIHQLHHSPLRIEALTAFFAHPLETVTATLISCFSSYILFGASEYAAAWALFFTGFFDLYLHSDTRSPKWLGYLIQRPEMHRVHHAYGHHAQNYGLPIWDMLFGTWHNPDEQVQQCGFDAPKAERICDMLRGQDVHRTAPSSR